MYKTWKYAFNKSTNNPNSVNSDLVGYGPGSKDFTFTITHTYKQKYFFERVEFSYVKINSYSMGSGFGADGNKSNQSRFGIEIGVMF